MNTSVTQIQEPAAPVAANGFVHLRSHTIESLNLSIEEYLHTNTGASHYHLACDNKENVFLVALRTVPTDSTGVAHILEHTVLCGSERYPVRDPFFMMIRRSLNTFMNAFTSSDWTAYPFASQNRKDFYNLLDVYLDAVFFSNLNELDFAQEGHRLEFQKSDDIDSELEFKGVVFNEMKGAMSSPISTLWQTLTKYLFPTTTYHFNSGGEPEDIPDLSYADLKQFYETHYHPSNAVFLTYGDIPAEELQAKFEAQALSRFQRSEANIQVNNEKRYLSPVSVEESYAIDASENDSAKTHIVTGWLLGPTTDLYSALISELVSGVLLDDSASPLRHALETSDLGTAPSPLCGLENSHKEMSFVCGLEGSSSEKAQAVEDLILTTLQSVVENGIPQERVSAVLHQLELEQREVGGNQYPYGLQLILDVLSTAVHHGDALSALDLEPVLEKLREDIKDPRFIPDQIQKLLLDNPHRVRLTLKPDTELSSRRELAEKNRLAQLKQSLTEEQKQNIVDLSKKLSERQMQVDDIDILPKVGLADVPKGLSIAQGNQIHIRNRPAHLYMAGTNGLIYQQVVTELPLLTEPQLAIMPYYTSCLTELGAGDQDYLTLQARQSSVSGGIGAYSSVRSDISDVQSVSGHLVFSGKALTKNHSAFNKLLHDVFTSARFDEHHRIRELMSQLRASREQGITGNGHVMAMRAASAGMSPTAALKHKLHGLAGIKSLKSLDDSLSEDKKLQAFCNQLAELHQQISNGNSQFLLIGEEDSLELMQKDCEMLWSDATQHENSAFALPETRGQIKELWTTSTSVNFCARSYPAVPSQHPDAPALSILGGFLRNGFLHRAIREQGGAYGGGASYDSESGSFTFYSYRDPRLEETLQDFDESIAWLLSEKHDGQQLEEAILGVISSLDKPSSPAGEAKEAFHNNLYGRTPEQRQAFRQRILTTTLDDLKRVGECYFDSSTASTAIITSPQKESVAEKLGLSINKV